MKMARIKWFWLVLLMLSGCPSVQWQPAPASGIPLPPRPKDSIEQPKQDGFGDDGDDQPSTLVGGLIRRSVLFGNPQKTEPQISHDGSRVAFLAPDGGVLNLWVAPTGDISCAKVMTRDRSRGISRFFWAYTNQHIIYLQDKGGDENWRAYSVDVQNGTEVDLTPLAGVKTTIQHVSHKHPGAILIGLNDRNKTFHDLHRIDLRSGKRTLVQQNDGYSGFVTDDDYQVRLAIKPTADGGKELLRLAGGKFVPFIKVSMEDGVTTVPVGFDASGTELYLKDSRGRNTSALVRLKLPYGKPQVVSHDPKADVARVLYHPTTGTIQAVASNYLRETWVFFDKQVEQDFAVLGKLTRGDIKVTSRTLDDTKWTVAVQTDSGPTRHFVYHRLSQQAVPLFAERPELEGLPLSPMRPVEIRSRDGLTLVSYLTLPPAFGTDKPPQPLPMVLLVHGGPWLRDWWGFHRWHQWLANRGYAVLSVNFRGSTGFGKRFINAGNGEWSTKMHDDLIDATQWAIAQGIAQTEKIAIMGASYGGYATLVGLTFTPERFACGVDIVGPSNLVTLFESFPPYWAKYIALVKRRVGDYTTPRGRKDLLNRSPVSRVEHISRPLLIGQGANDPRVKQAESDQIVKAMKDRDIPVTYALFPDEGHGFHRPENDIAFNAVAEIFLSRCLGGKAQAIGGDFAGASIQVPTGAEHVPGLAEALQAR